MKKLIKIFLTLVFIFGFGLILIFSGFRGATKTEILSLTQVPAKFSQTLFFNDFFSHFQGISVGEDLPLKKFRADLHTLQIRKGRVTDTENFTLTGREIVFGFWGLAGILNGKMDHVTLNFRMNRRLSLEVMAIPKSAGVFQKTADAVKEVLGKRIPSGKVIFRSSIPPKAKTRFAAVMIPLAQLQRDPHNRWEGLIFTFRSGRRKPLLLNLGGLVFSSQASGRFINQIKSDYYVYGGAERRKLKSVFIPSGTRLTYRIHCSPTPGGEKDGRIFFDGYLEKLQNDPMRFELIVNGEKVMSREVVKSDRPSYFRSSIRQTQKDLLMEIHVNGSKGNSCVLGNMNIFRKHEIKQNVVIYLIDALRADKGGIGLNPFAKHFKRGRIFSTAYSNATRTIDSLPTIFSGKYKYALIGKDTSKAISINNREFLLAEYLKQKGYVTAAFINNPNLDIANAIQGFDMVNHCWSAVSKCSFIPSIENYNNLKYGELWSQLERFIAENGQKPVFIFFHMMEPHVPYEVPMEMRHYSKHADKKILKTLYGHIKPFPCYHRLVDPDIQELDTLKNLYRDSVRTSYDHFKKMENYLQKSNILNGEGLFIFTSDHGERFYEHRSWTHGPPDIYNEVIRIPLMIRGRGISAGRFHQSVQLADIFPTIRDWFGDPRNPELPGMSLKRITHRESVSPRWIYVDGTADFPQYALIRSNMKIIRNRDEYELYNLDQDPAEKHKLNTEGKLEEMVEFAGRFRNRINKSLKQSKQPRKLPEKVLKRLKTLGYLN